MPLHVTRAVAVNLFCHMESKHKLLLILWTGTCRGRGDGQTVSPMCILHGALHTLQRDPSAGVSEVMVRTVLVPVLQWQARGSGPAGASSSHTGAVYGSATYNINLCFIISLQSVVLCHR